MKKLLAMLAFMMTFSMSFQGVVAQGSTTTATDDVVADENGMIYSYERTYEVDIWTLMEDPDFDFENIDFFALLMDTVTIEVSGFDSEANAIAYFESGIDTMNAGLDADSDFDYEITFPQEFGPHAVKIVANSQSDPDADEDDIQINMTLIVFVDGSDIFTISVLNADPAVADSTAQAVAEYVRDAEVTTDEITINEDGTFSGGVFDRMPASGSDIVNGLTATDYDHDDDGDWDDDFDWDTASDGSGEYDYREPAPQGFVYGYSRTYVPDFTTMSDDSDTEEIDWTALFSQSSTIMIYGFDTEANAQAYVKQSLQEMSMDTSVEEMGIVVTNLSDDFGREGVAVTMDQFGVTMGMVAFVDGTDVIVIIALGTDLDAASAQAMAMAEFVRDHPAGSAEVVFTDSQATGGAFDRMPGAGDDIVSGLTWEDNDLSNNFITGDE